MRIATVHELERERDQIMRTLAYDQYHQPLDGEHFITAFASEVQQDEQRVTFLNQRIAAMRRAREIAG